MKGLIHFHEQVSHLLEPAENLEPYQRNPNNGDVDLIMESISTVGCYRPVYVGSDGVIVAGHHLYAALMEMGADQIPVMRLDYPSTDERSVRIVIGDNEIARKARRDEAQLLSLVREVLDGDLRGTGLSDFDLLRLVDDVETPLPEGFSASNPWPVVQIPCPEDVYVAWHDRLAENGDLPPHELLINLMERDL